ncbi:MAG: FHA domain-containing protein [Planctomycetes bacterium]|nr:FHA domain-containing protein [Planctomycetota bacterium]
MTHHSNINPRQQPAEPAPPEALAAPRDEAGSIFADNTSASYGVLQPVGGGDPIPLLKTVLVIGRRESCDIVLRFPNVSGTHCQLSLVNGKWFVKDLGSSNGTKINGSRVTEGPIESGSRVAVGRHEYELSHTASAHGETSIPARLAAQRDIFSRSLLASAGLESHKARTASDKSGRSRS